MSEKSIPGERWWSTALRVAAVAAAVLLVTAGTLALVYRERLATDGVLGLFTGGAAALDDDAFYYGEGSNQVFAQAGDGLAVASSSSLALFDARGRALFRRAVSYEAPAVFASESGALFCDLGGTGCVAVTAKGDSREIAPGGAILTASRSAAGWVALGTEEPGCKGLVSVYDAGGALRYRWWSGTGYLLRCLVSSDGKHLAALCAESGGGRLHLFRLDSEEEQASVFFPGDLPCDLYCFENGAYCVLGTSTLYFLDAEGVETGRADTGGALLDYAFGEAGFTAVLTAPSLAAEHAYLTALDSRGAVLGSLELEGTAAAFSIRGRRLLLCAGGTLSLRDRSLSAVWTGPAPAGTARALLRGRGTALLPGPYAAEAVEIG
ncbi:MAG: hypothetical protein IJ617_08245 [Oscillospiraceae bacterium]|nr:hypothetical protein [Oscillospiraceae bacterium]